MSVFDTSFRPEDVGSAAASASIQTIERGVVADARKLLSQSHEVFAQLQTKLSEAGLTQEQRREILQTANNRYLTLLVQQHNIACARLLEDNSAAEQRRLEEQRMKWFNSVLVWGLNGVFSILPCAYIIDELAAWAFIAAKCRESAQLESPEVTWNRVFRLVLIGRVKEAAEAMRLLVDVTSEEQQLPRLREVERLLVSMPRLRDMSRPAFSAAWQQWHEMCLQVRSLPDLPTNTLRVVVDLLAGVEQAIYGVAGATDAEWYEVFVALVLYSEPETTNDSAAPVILSRLLEGRQPLVGEGGLDRILVSTIRRDVPNMVFECHEQAFTNWFLAHAVDFLIHCKVDMLADCVNDDGLDLREFFLLEYADDLTMHANSFWQLAASYLPFCEKRGKARLEVLVERVPLDSERTAYKLLRLCKLHGLEEQAETIYRVMGTQRLPGGAAHVDTRAGARYGGAIHWLKKARDSTCVSRLARHLISLFTARVGQSEGEWLGSTSEIEAVLENLGEEFAAERDFLSAYSAFLKLQKTHGDSQVAQQLQVLLESPVPSLEFHAKLLAAGFGPMLRKHIVSVSCSHALLRKLELLCREHGEAAVDEELRAYDGYSLAELRIAVAGCLARGFLSGPLQ